MFLKLENGTSELLCIEKQILCGDSQIEMSLFLVHLWVVTCMNSVNSTVCCVLFHFTLLMNWVSDWLVFGRFNCQNKYLGHYAHFLEGLIKLISLSVWKTSSNYRALNTSTSP